MQGNAGKNALQNFQSLERQRQMTVTVWNCHVQRGMDFDKIDIYSADSCIHCMVKIALPCNQMVCFAVDAKACAALSFLCDFQFVL